MVHHCQNRMETRSSHSLRHSHAFNCWCCRNDVLPPWSHLIGLCPRSQIPTTSPEQPPSGKTWGA